jgi:hypothetical protein
MVYHAKTKILTAWGSYEWTDEQAITAESPVHCGAGLQNPTSDLRVLPLRSRVIMTRETRFEGSITTSEAFSDTFRELLLAAHANDVDVSGAWEFRFDGSAPDWEAVVVELAKEGTGSSGAE